MNSIKSVTAIVAIALMAAGCSNIGKVNGYRIAQVGGTPPPPSNPSFCEEHTEWCIVGGIILTGAAGYGIARAIDSSNEESEGKKEEKEND